MLFCFVFKRLEFWHRDCKERLSFNTIFFGIATMDISGVTSKQTQQSSAGGTSGQNGASDGTSSVFASLLKNAGSRIDQTLNALGSHPMTNKQSADPAADTGRGDEYATEKDRGYDDVRADEGRRNDDRPSDKPKDDHVDDTAARDRNDGNDRRADNDNNDGKEQVKSKDDNDQGQNEDRRESSAKDNSDQNDGETADTAADETTETAGSETQQSGENAGQGKTDKPAENVAANAQAGLGQVVSQMGSDKSTKVDGQEVKAMAQTQGANANKATGEQQLAGGQNNDTLDTKGQSAQTQAQGQAQAARANQGQNQSQQNQAQAGGDNQNVARQAAELSKSMASDKPAQVKVTVENQNAQVTDQPKMTAQTAAGLNDAGKQATTGQQTGQQSANTNSNAPSQQNAANQAAQQAQAQAAAQNGQQQAQAQQATNANASAQAKSVAQVGAQQAASGGQVQAGGGEMANAGQVGQTQQAAQAQQTASAAQTAKTAHTAKPAEVVHQVSVQISKAVQAGTDKITIQLRPESMGRVEVQLEVSKSGQVTANVVADRPETLNMLKNDSASLEKALQDAGLDAGDMNFNLRGEQSEQQAEGSGNGHAGGSEADGEDEPINPLLAAQEEAMSNGRWGGRANGVDVRV